MNLNDPAAPIQRVKWDGFPALFKTARLSVVQVLLWSPVINRWVGVAMKPTGNTALVEVTPGDVDRMHVLLEHGHPLLAVFQRVLGI